MGEPVIQIVGSKTEEDLRRAALDRLGDLVEVIPLLGREEFTRQDAKERWGWTEAQARKALEQLVADGTLESGDRRDPRTKRRCMGYWFKG